MFVRAIIYLAFLILLPLLNFSPFWKGNAMKLTGRQKDFLSKFLDLYRKTDHPLHYAALARKLGVTKIAAYDMLRLLEERGLVTSEYVLPEGGGPGRSSIVFSPTEKAATLMAQLAGEDWDTAEWDEVKERILTALREGKGTDYQNLLEDILLRIPERKSPMLYAAEMITAVLLNLHQLREEAKAGSLRENLRALGWPGELGLNALAGLTLGLTLVEKANRRITTLLLSYAQKYQDHLAKLSAENKKRLSDFAQEVMKIVGI
jgi:predicted ArsR family transcriptional regulator